jgi:hypothetical protein
MILALISLDGRTRKKNVSRYRIKWDAPSRSILQFNVKQLLKAVWNFDVVFEEFPVYGSKMRVDFFNATRQIAIEANGPQHEKFNPFFHNNSKANFMASVTRDLQKYDWLQSNGITLVEYIEADTKDVKLFYSKLYS